MDARNPQDRVYTFVITDRSSSGGGGDTSFRGVGGVDGSLDHSLLSGLGRRVSSIWSFATSRVSTLNATLSGASNTVVRVGFFLQAQFTLPNCMIAL